jgi:FdhD protein
MAERVTQIARDGSSQAISRKWVDEAPIAIEFNGLAYAVMMATPADLGDFVRGFAITEGLVGDVEQVGEIAIAETDKGVIARANLANLGLEQLNERVRMRVAESSCGLCGVENLEAVTKPLPKVKLHVAPSHDAIFRAIESLPDQQALNRATGAAHAAAFATGKGAIQLVREDVGRHNAIDKLVGAMVADQIQPSAGFFISTARCSYEIVEKVVKAGGVALVTVSLPTNFAIERARDAGLSLCCLARGDSYLDLTA